MSEFDINWPFGYTTRDGRPARIICTDAKGCEPLVVLLPCRLDCELAMTYGINGKRLLGDDCEDLINAPAPKRRVWHVWRSVGTKEEAERLTSLLEVNMDLSFGIREVDMGERDASSAPNEDQFAETLRKVIAERMPSLVEKQAEKPKRTVWRVYRDFHDRKYALEFQRDIGNELDKFVSVAEIPEEGTGM